MIRFRISLKWFLLGTTAIALLIGTVGKRGYDDWHRRVWLARQQQIAEELTTSGGGVLLRDGRVVEAHFGPRTGGAKAMSWLKDATDLEKLRADCPLTDDDIALLSRHWKLHHLFINDASPAITNQSLQTIGRLETLQSVSLGYLAINDDGLVYLGELTELTELNLFFSPIQGRGLIHIARLPKLQYLCLRGSTVTDEGLIALAKCTSLVRLELDKTNISGSELGHLSGLPKLTKLNLAGTRITSGEGFAELNQVEELDLTEAQISPGVLTHIAHMDNLRRLDLSRTSVTDDMLAELKNSRQIKSVGLLNTKISDAGVVHLRNHHQLDFLGMVGTAVSETMARELSRELPGATISYGKNGVIRDNVKGRFEALQPEWQR